jgi:hemerythrin-like domain-containing protein
VLAFYRGTAKLHPVPLTVPLTIPIWEGASTITMPESAPACAHLRKDHRVIEESLDILLAALLRLTPPLIPAIQATVRALQDLAAIHFEKEETIFYPKVRPLLSDLLDRMDVQHEEVREVERYLAELLAQPPQPPDSRWLNEVRSFGIEFHDRIQHHIVDEEDQLLRLAEDRLTPEEQESLAAAMSAVQSRITSM